MASLSKDQVLPEIAKRLNELYEKKIHLEEALKSAPEGNLRTAKKGKAFQFYLITEKADSKGKYLSLKNPVEKELVKKLAQRDYDKKALRQIEDDIRTLEKVSHSYKPDELEQIFLQLNEGRKSFVHPLRLPDDDFALRWQAVKYKRLDFDEGTAFFMTAKGEKVRSEAEMNIADALDRNNVPYHYEFPFNLKTLGKIYTNFICFNRRTGKEFIWEHFGQMDDPSQAAKSVDRLQGFQMCGMFSGEKLIVTMETSEKKLSKELVERLIQKYLL